MRSTEESRALAEDTLRWIEANPDKHDQRLFFGIGERGAEDLTGVPREATWFEGGSCGTTMCVAGTALWLTYGIDALGIEENYSDAAGKLLGLENESEINAMFFDMDNERVLTKLKKIAVGEQFSPADLFED